MVRSAVTVLEPASFDGVVDAENVSLRDLGFAVHVPSDSDHDPDRVVSDVHVLPE